MSNNNKDNHKFSMLERICRRCWKTYEISSVITDEKTVCPSCRLENININRTFDLNHNQERSK